MIHKFLKKYDFLELFDILVISYFIILSIILLFFHGGLDNWWIYIVFHMMSIFIIFFFIKKVAFSSNKVLRFLRYFYPFILLIFMYLELNKFVLIIFERYKDPYVHKLEYLLFGFYPTVILDKIVNPFITEFLAIFYFSYYLIIICPLIYFYNKGKRIALRDFLDTILLGFCISYIVSIIFPLQGPKLEMAYLYTTDITGIIFTPLKSFIVKYFGIYRESVSALHITTATISLIMVKRYINKLFPFMLVIFLLMVTGIMYYRQGYFLVILCSFAIAWLVISMKSILYNYILKLKNSNSGL